VRSAGHILVLDDEPAICAVVKQCLEPGGFRVQAAHTTEEFRRRLRREAYDLVILDLNLPGEDGLGLLKEIGRETSIPTIILTARGEPVDRVVGLEMGADDYVPKPFEPRELLARVRSVLRRARRPAAGDLPRGQVLCFEGFTLDPNSRQLLAPKGEPVTLTTSEFEILHVLATHPNRALSREQIMNLARRREATPFDRSIDVHIGHLRRKIEKDVHSPRVIKTVHGVGYIFSAKVEPRAAPG
jgi:two-component system OmpR family response regulator